MNPAIFLSPWLWLAIASAAAAFCANGWRASHDAFVSFQAVQKALAEEQEKRTAARIQADKANQEKTDAETETALADLRARIAGLRNKRPDTGFVPAAPAASSRPDLACFDRAEFERASGILVGDLRRIAQAGSEATIALNAGKAWGLRMSQEIRP